jgi:prolyl oligopeptidase PreP (S9A serine peptidase family)
MLKDIPVEALEKGNKQPMLIFTGMKSERVLPHHSDDLIEIANQNDIKYEIYKYDDMGHTEALFVYTEEYSQILTEFYQETLND